MMRYANLLLPTLIASSLYPDSRTFLVVVVLDAGSGRLEIELGSVGRSLARLDFASGGGLHFDAIAMRRRVDAAP